MDNPSTPEQFQFAAYGVRGTCNVCGAYCVSTLWLPCPLCHYNPPPREPLADITNRFDTTMDEERRYQALIAAAEDARIRAMASRNPPGYTPPPYSPFSQYHDRVYNDGLSWQGAPIPNFADNLRGPINSSLRPWLTTQQEEKKEDEKEEEEEQDNALEDTFRGKTTIDYISDVTNSDEECNTENIGHHAKINHE